MKLILSTIIILLISCSVYAQSISDQCSATSMLNTKAIVDGNGASMSIRISQAIEYIGAQARRNRCTDLSNEVAGKYLEQANDLYLFIWSTIWLQVPESIYECSTPLPVNCEVLDSTEEKAELIKSARRLQRILNKISNVDCLSDHGAMFMLRNDSKKSRNEISEQINLIPDTITHCS